MSHDRSEEYLRASWESYGCVCVLTLFVVGLIKVFIVCAVLIVSLKGLHKYHKYLSFATMFGT